MGTAQDSGVTLRGRLFDVAGEPAANERLLLVPSYTGSGPASKVATTDENGFFEFPRTVADLFDLVVGSLSNWHSLVRNREFQGLWSVLLLRDGTAGLNETAAARAPVATWGEGEVLWEGTIGPQGAEIALILPS